MLPGERKTMASAPFLELEGFWETTGGVGNKGLRNWETTVRELEIVMMRTKMAKITKWKQQNECDFIQKWKIKEMNRLSHWDGSDEFPRLVTSTLKYSHCNGLFTQKWCNHHHHHHHHHQCNGDAEMLHNFGSKLTLTISLDIFKSFSFCCKFCFETSLMEGARFLIAS